MVYIEQKKLKLNQSRSLTFSGETTASKIEQSSVGHWVCRTQGSRFYFFSGRLTGKFMFVGLVFLAFQIISSSALAVQIRGQYAGGKIKYIENDDENGRFSANFDMSLDFYSDEWDLLQKLHMKMRCGDKFSHANSSYLRPKAGGKGLLESTELKFDCLAKPMHSGETEEMTMMKIKDMCKRSGTRHLADHCKRVLGE
jgi:hypothetical protein